MHRNILSLQLILRFLWILRLKRILKRKDVFMAYRLNKSKFTENCSDSKENFSCLEKLKAMRSQFCLRE